MRQKLSNMLHFLATFSFYFFLIFIPQSILLFLVLRIIEIRFDCQYPACFEGWFLPFVVLNVAIVVILARKNGFPLSPKPSPLDDLSPEQAKETIGQRTCLQLIFAVPLVFFASCSLIFFIFAAWENVWGTIVERVIHYPNSDLILVEHGVYGSTDYGAAVHLRWTEDTVAQVEAHYDRFSLYREYAHIIDSKDDVLEFTACVWEIAFRPTMFEEPKEHPCDLVKRMLDERGGTLIEFSYYHFMG